VPGFQDRAALIDFLRNFYLVQQTGNQRVWVLDGAPGIEHWMYDELSGKTRDEVRGKLAFNVFEALGPNVRGMLPQALQIARKWAMDIVSRLSAPDAETTAMVKRWFLIGDPGEGKVRRTTATLLSGFKKIAAMSNASDVIFSDDPLLRKRDPKLRGIRAAAVFVAEKMTVIYIFPGFLKWAKRDQLGHYPEMWQAANAMVHELSHRALKTEDNPAIIRGLNPRPDYTPDDALKSADSWAYFATHMAGALPKQVLENALDE
jgi:Lysine-specific metallo-endopeptidase